MMATCVWMHVYNALLVDAYKDDEISLLFIYLYGECGDLRWCKKTNMVQSCYVKLYIRDEEFVSRESILIIEILLVKEKKIHTYSILQNEYWSIQLKSNFSYIFRLIAGETRLHRLTDSLEIRINSTHSLLILCCEVFVHV